MPIKLIVARNLAELRKARGLTQSELADRFNYSDKSISKWEHGETMPDIEVLKQLCDFYGVTLDYLVQENPSPETIKVRKQTRVANKWIITWLSVSCVWLLAVVGYIAGHIIVGETEWPRIGWLCFAWGVPASCVVMLVFNGIWGRSSWRTIIAIVLTWSTLACVYLSLVFFIQNGAQLWPLFLIGVPLTVASILWDHVLKPVDSK